jgi:hypothetical protein
MSHKTKNKEKKRNPDEWIEPGDMVFLKKDEIAFPVLGPNWTYNPNIMRLLLLEDPVIYIKRSREGRGGDWVHHIDVFGLTYVFKGSIKDFEKKPI